MFREWGFLLTEIWVLLLLASLLGLLAGWIIWGRTRNAENTTVLEDRLKNCDLALDQCRAQSAQLEKQLSAANSKPKTIAKTATKKSTSAKPSILKKPRGGKADDLKRIKGIGPKLETLTNSLGFYHFDQIAKWSNKEIAWVDDNLEGFKGRVTRDKWVSQAKTLAKGGQTAFSKKVDKGGVY